MKKHFHIKKTCRNFLAVGGSVAAVATLGFVGYQAATNNDGVNAIQK